MAAILTLESDWVVALLGGLVSLFSALAWFVRQTVNNGVKGLEGRMSRDLDEIKTHMASDLTEIKAHVQDVGERVGRLEQQVDDTIIPKQERIARKLDTEDEQ